MLHELVARHAQTMLAELRDADPEGGGLPRYVERELAAYLRCGVLAHGFTRVRCQTCHHEIVVAFSCKSRGICPSCTARRMADTAAHLVTRVLPRAPYRQWVFTVPKPLRLVLARDPVWTSFVGNACVRAIGAWQRRVARRRGLRGSRTGAVMFVQRFGGLVNLNVHFHLVVADGVFVDDGDGLRFAMHPVPTSADVLAILDRIVRLVVHRLAANARDDHDADAPPDVLAQVQAEAAATWRSPSDLKPTVRGAERLRAWHEGFSLHAGVVIADHDRDALERLCRYGARPAFAQDRLAWTGDGRVAYPLKRPWARRPHRARATAGRVPAPLMRDHSAAAPAPRSVQWNLRPCEQTPRQAPRARAPREDVEPERCTAAASGSSRSGPLPWADLLRRVFADDVLQCPCVTERAC